MSRRLAMVLRLAGFAVVLGISAADAQVLITPSGAGHQLPNIGWTPDNNHDPFWDNVSADGTPLATKCNVGFFALGTMQAGCHNVLPGTFANLPSSNPYYRTTNGPDPFGFAPGTYYVTLLGGLHNSQSALFTYSLACWPVLGLNCGDMTINTLTEFTESDVGHTYYLDYSSLTFEYPATGVYWGFGYANNFNPTWGWPGFGEGYTAWFSGFNLGTSVPAPGDVPQFFTLFESQVPCEWGYFCYLVGVEDNALAYLGSGQSRDADYQDWLILVTPTPEPGTVALLATGLVGLAGAGLIQRRRHKG